MRADEPSLRSRKGRRWLQNRYLALRAGGMTQTDARRLTGVPRKTAYRWEQAEREGRVEPLKPRLDNAYGSVPPPEGRRMSKGNFEPERRQRPQDPLQLAEAAADAPETPAHVSEGVRASLNAVEEALGAPGPTGRRPTSSDNRPTWDQLRRSGAVGPKGRPLGQGFPILGPDREVQAHTRRI